ncbi:MAG: DUF1049 domain-containing protein [Methylomicrobium sp.]|nr:DUF1049 domain-containing protein [Methylomicrobium sp.]
MKLIVAIVFILIFSVALIFSILNFQWVEINLFFFSISLPLVVALTIELFAGILIGYLVAANEIFKLKSQNSKLNKFSDK